MGGLLVPPGPAVLMASSGVRVAYLATAVPIRGTYFMTEWGALKPDFYQVGDGDVFVELGSAGALVGVHRIVETEETSEGFLFRVRSLGAVPLDPEALAALEGAWYFRQAPDWLVASLASAGLL